MPATGRGRRRRPTPRSGAGASAQRVHRASPTAPHPPTHTHAVPHTGGRRRRCPPYRLTRKASIWPALCPAEVGSPPPRIATAVDAEMQSQLTRTRASIGVDPLRHGGGRAGQHRGPTPRQPRRPGPPIASSPGTGARARRLTRAPPGPVPHSPREALVMGPSKCARAGSIRATRSNVSGGPRTP